MTISDQKVNWNRFAQINPYYAIMTIPGQTWTEKDFYASGKDQINHIMQSPVMIDRGKGKALDFGCGIGRLTQALLSYFDEVIGIDISEKMLSLAREYNKSAKCKYLLNECAPVLAADDNQYDFVISLLVLQHIENNDTEKYIHELIRVLKPNGIFIYQLPTDSGGGLETVDAKYEMHGMAIDNVMKIIEEGDGILIEVSQENVSTCTDSYLYFVTKSKIDGR